MTKYQITFITTLVSRGWTHEDAARLAGSEYVGRCVAQGESAEDAANGMADRYPA